MKRLLIVSGRYVVENPYREFRLKSLFEEKGIEVVFAIPSRRLNANGYPEELRSDIIFCQEGAVWFDSEKDLKPHLKYCDALLLGSWKTYGVISEIARLLGKPVISHDTTGGFDHWVIGANYACSKSEFSKRLMLYLEKDKADQAGLTSDKIIPTGSIIHDKYFSEKNSLTISRETFCDQYGLDKSRSISVLFPKGIGSFQAKIPAWFPKWSKKEHDRYDFWFRDKYAKICEMVRQSGVNLIIKMHPSAYASYRSRVSVEFDYWKQFPWARILRPEDTHSCFKHLDFGIGVSTHSALDVGLYKKPFVYVDSDLIEPPPGKSFHYHHLCKLPLGPSSKWKKGTNSDVNPWFPSWLGYSSRVEDLPAILMDSSNQLIPEDLWKRFVDEFWYRADGKAAERIVEFVIDKLESWDKKNKIYQIMGQRVSIMKAMQKRAYLALRRRLSTAIQ